MIPDGVDLTPTERAMFYALTVHGPSTIPELADASNTPYSSVRHALRELCEQGLVQREFTPTDARQKRYRVSVESHRKRQDSDPSATSKR